MDLKKSLGAKIKYLRKSKNLTQEKLSEMVNITPRQMVRIEMGQNIQSIENLENIANCLGVKVSDVFQNESFDNITSLKTEILSKIDNLDEKTIRFLYSVVSNL